MPDKKKKSHGKPPVYPKKSEKTEDNKNYLPKTTITAPTMYPNSKMKSLPKSTRSSINYTGMKTHEIKYPKPSTKLSPTRIPTRNAKNTMLEYLKMKPVSNISSSSYPISVPPHHRNLFPSNDKKKTKKKTEK